MIFRRQEKEWGDEVSHAEQHNTTYSSTGEEKQVLFLWENIQTLEMETEEKE